MTDKQRRGAEFSGEALKKLTDAEDFVLVTYVPDEEGELAVDVFITSPIFAPHARDLVDRWYKENTKGDFGDDDL